MGKKLTDQRYLLAASSACLTLLLSACGGGSDGTTAATPDTTAASGQAVIASAGSSTLTDAGKAYAYGRHSSSSTSSSTTSSSSTSSTSTTETTTSPTPTSTSTSTTSSTPTTTTTTPPTSTTSSTSTSTSSSTTGTASGTRDPLKWPFAATSIWNMPIGTGAVYVPANLSADPGNDVWAPMPQVDDERIVLRPTAPLTPINYSSAGWSGSNRCTSTGSQLISVPMPSDFVVANSKANNSAAFLAADGHTVIQTQPLARCTAGGYATSLVKFASVDLYGDGITGAHGGSGLSALGGSIRVGELRPGSQGPRHALKVNVYAKQELYRCTTKADCYRWPAVTADSYAVGFYGSVGGNSNSAMKMGSLLAIPRNVNIGSLGLETEPGKQLAWTLQNYGAYIVDDTYGPGFAINVENGPDGSVRAQFKADYGLDLEERVNSNTAWSRDVQRLRQALYVVNNNSPTSIGGGGTPLQPLAPAFQ